MPFGNSNLNTDKEFYMGCARLVDSTAATIKKYWLEVFVEYIIRTLYYRGSIRLPHLGTFSLKHMAETISVQTGPDGEQVTYRVPERDVPYFTPHDDMINDINMQGVTKLYRKRAKREELTEWDFRRKKRAEKLGVFGSISQERANASRAEFQEKLKQRKAEHVGQQEDEDDETDE